MTINLIYSEKMQKTIHDVCPAPDYTERTRTPMRSWKEKIQNLVNATNALYFNQNDGADEGISAIIQLINKNPGKNTIFECQYFEKNFYIMADSEEEACGMIKVAAVMNS